MGGPMSVNDPLPWIEPELELIRKAVACNMPVLGHCLGGQLISKALGGVISANPVKEFGWLDVTQQNNAAAHSWLGALPQRFPAFHWHGETFSIPAGAALILSSDHCRNQAFVIGNTLALQCHVEMSAAMVREWAALEPEAIASTTPSIQNWEQMSARLDERVHLLQHHADLLYQRWLQPLLAKTNI
jgi:GMP synthase-like glutamine amidotransferase